MAVFFKKIKEKESKESKWTYREEELESLTSQIKDAKSYMIDCVKDVIASQRLINILPDGADKGKEQEYLFNAKHSLLSAIGWYDDRRAEYDRKFNQYAEEVGGIENLNIRFLIWKNSHEILRRALLQIEKF